MSKKFYNPGWRNGPEVDKEKMYFESNKRYFYSFKDFYHYVKSAARYNIFHWGSEEGKDGSIIYKYVWPFMGEYRVDVFIYAPNDRAAGLLEETLYLEVKSLDDPSLRKIASGLRRIMDNWYYGIGESNRRVCSKEDMDGWLKSLDGSEKEDISQKTKKELVNTLWIMGDCEGCVEGDEEKEKQKQNESKTKARAKARGAKR